MAKTNKRPDRVSFIKVCQHDNFATALLPNHPPEVRNSQISGAWIEQNDSNVSLKKQQ